MEQQRKIRLAIVQGDSNGVGYELIFKTFLETETLDLFTPVVYGSPKIAAYHRKALNVAGNFSIISHAEEIKDGRVNLMTCFDDEVKVELGTATPESAQAARRSLEKAIHDAEGGVVDAIVLTPMQAERLAGDVLKGSTMMLLDERLRVALATCGLPIREVASSLTKELVAEKARLLLKVLKRDLFISNPRIAILALNPDAQGKEEQDMLAPVVKELSEEGLQAFGPYPADRLFSSGEYEAFDAILAMYDDQGIVPFKALTNDEDCRYFAGLPYVLTATPQDPLFDEAGKGIADEMSLRHALYSAIDIVRHRADYDEAKHNPLPKLFHEKRDESEKVRFNIPKKRAPFGTDKSREEQQPAKEETPQQPEAKPEA